MSDNYNKAYKEVIEILKQLSESDKNKIPKEIYQALEEKMDKDYTFEFNKCKTLEEQIFLNETKAILAVFYRDYWATPEIKAKILAKQTNELIKLEQEKKIRYNSEQLFKKEEENTKMELIVYKKENWYIKFIEIFKKVFIKQRDNC